MHIIRFIGLRAIDRCGTAASQWTQRGRTVPPPARKSPLLPTRTSGRIYPGSWDEIGKRTGARKAAALIEWRWGVGGAGGTPCEFWLALQGGGTTVVAGNAPVSELRQASRHNQ